MRPRRGGRRRSGCLALEAQAEDGRRYGQGWYARRKVLADPTSGIPRAATMAQRRLALARAKGVILSDQ